MAQVAHKEIELVTSNFDQLRKLINRSNEKPQQILTSFETPTSTSMKFFRYDKASPLGVFSLGLRIPGARSDDASAISLLSSYLTVGNSSLVQESLVRSGLSAFAIAFTSSFETLDDRMRALRAVTVKKYDEVRKKILTHLNGTYLMLGTLGDFHPEFPEGTWTGKFE